MNERIKELAIFSGYNGHYCTEEFDPEQFAKFIVQECARLVQGIPTDSMGYHTADQKIKEHFEM